MTTIHVIELAKATPQPWRNGGGVTRELLAWPVGSGGDWLVRVSVADIDRDGPFSPFPGVQRCFTVLEGAGVVLGFAGADTQLTPDSPPLAFDGADAPGCRLLGGSTRDLNLMARHTAGRARMWPAAVGDPLPAPARWCGLYTRSPLTLTARVETPCHIPAHSLAWCDNAEPGEWRLAPADGSSSTPRAWWLSLQATA